MDINQAFEAWHDKEALCKQVQRKTRRGRGEDFFTCEGGQFRRYPCGCVYSYDTKKWKDLCGQHGKSNPL